MCYSEWWEYHHEIIVDGDRNVRKDINDCLSVMGTAASKIFVEGIIGRMYIVDELIGSVKIIHYGYIKLARAMDVKQLNLILPLSNAEMKPANEKGVGGNEFQLRLFRSL